MHTRTLCQRMIARWLRRSGRPVRASSTPDNPWWENLRKRSSGTVFTVPDGEAFEACERIFRVYEDLLKRYRIDREQLAAGSIKAEDAAALYALVRAARPALAYQVGTFAGYSALVIAEAQRRAGGGQLVACDPELPHRTVVNPVSLARMAADRLGLAGAIRWVCGWNAVPMGEGFSDRIKATIPIVGPTTLQALGRPIDFALIDGDHSVASTLCDLTLVQAFLRVGGTIVLHDARSWPTVALAVQIFLDDRYFYYRGTSAYFAVDTWPGPDGLAALRRTKPVRHPMLRLRVLDGLSGEPIDQACVRIPAVGFEGVTGPDGHIYHFGEVPCGAEIHVSAAGYLSQSLPNPAPTDGDFAGHEVRLPRASVPLES